MTEPGTKRERLLAVLRAHDLDALVVRDPANLAWYLDGARVHVAQLADTAILEVSVTRAGGELRTSVIEAPRLAAEELGPDAPPVRALPWWESLGEPGGARCGSDQPRGGEVDLAGALTAARSALTGAEIDRYRELGRDTAAAAAASLREGRAEESEFSLAGRAARHLLEREVEPLVLLVAGAERLPAHRHPLPTASRLGDRAMLVVCGRRRGLICSLTRMRAFVALSTSERDRYAALLEVEAHALEATRPGARIGDVVAATAAAYGAHGFPPDEWHAHHQGGPTGYATRDYLASPATGEVALEHQAFAWNPSGGGFKVEDTVLATADGVEILSPDPDWPAIEVAGRARPAVLET